MGNGMNKIIPGLYIGNYRDSKDAEQHKTNGITHILSAHDNARELVEGMRYLCIRISDAPNENISKHFATSNEFIHRARRMENGGVCVHCLAGVSRSVTITTAYIMTVCDLGWRDALNAIRAARRVANPNIGFQRQLANFERDGLKEEQARLRALFGDAPLDPDGADRRECLRLLESFEALQKSVGDSVTLYTDYTVSYKDYSSLVNNDRFGAEKHPQSRQQSEGPNLTSKSNREEAEPKLANSADTKTEQVAASLSRGVVTVRLAENTDVSSNKQDGASNGELKATSWLGADGNKRSTADASSSSAAAVNETDADTRVVANEVERLIQVHRTAMSATGGDADSSPVLTYLTLAANAEPTQASVQSSATNSSSEHVSPKLVVVSQNDAIQTGSRNYETVDHTDAITVSRDEKSQATLK